MDRSISSLNSAKLESFIESVLLESSRQKDIVRAGDKKRGSDRVSLDSFRLPWIFRTNSAKRELCFRSWA